MFRLTNWRWQANRFDLALIAPGRRATLHSPLNRTSGGAVSHARLIAEMRYFLDKQVVLDLKSPYVCERERESLFVCV